jgi:hypothetical protein
VQRGARAQGRMEWNDASPIIAAVRLRNWITKLDQDRRTLTAQLEEVEAEMTDVERREVQIRIKKNAGGKRG